MALVQLRDPAGEEPARHEPRPAIGIDLGTTNSLVATMVDGRPQVVRDGAGGAMLPSVVHYSGSGTLVGEDARRLKGTDPGNTFSSVKRLMGRSREEALAAPRGYEYADGEGMVRLVTRAGVRTPVEISAEILSSLRRRAEAFLGRPVRDAVITVPAYFDDAQRQATKDAASLAGLDTLRLLNEPTAAAVAHGLDTRGEGIHVVYDLGGGTFDVSVLRLSRGVYEVMATGGDTALGGDDYDERLAGLLARRAGLPEGTPGGEWNRIVAGARETKERLTFADTAAGNAGLSVSRQEFEEATADLTARTLTIVRRTMRDAGIGAGDVDAVLLVGGSTRMPGVARAIREHFGIDPEEGIDPDQVVALGAAIQADILAGNRREDLLLLDVIPLSLGLEIGGGLVERIVPRNTAIPIKRAQLFTNQADTQTAVSLHVVQGERELASDCRSLARFRLGGIPPMAAGTARVQVTFQVDMDGLLTVSAVEQSAGKAAQVEVKPSYGLGEGEIADMLRDSFAHAADDRDARSLAESREDARQMVRMLRAALDAEGDRLLDAGERQAIGERIREVEQAALGDDPEDIRRACKALDDASAEFAERRMSAAIKSALAGKSVEEVGKAK